MEWAGHDVKTDNGVRIEVKASGYLQAWDQRGPSSIRFTGLRARTRTPDHGRCATASHNAHVYVFAVQTARDHAGYLPLDTAEWEFYVLPRTTLETLDVSSIGLNAVRQAAGPPVPFADLALRIQDAAGNLPVPTTPVTRAPVRTIRNPPRRAAVGRAARPFNDARWAGSAGPGRR